MFFIIILECIIRVWIADMILICFFFFGYHRNTFRDRLRVSLSY